MKGNWSKLIILGFAAIVFATGAFLFIKTREPRFNFPNDNKTLFFADGGSPLSALLYIAYEKTFLFTQKVNFHLSLYPTGRQALTALLDGKADLASVGDVPIVHAALEGKEFFIIATIGNSRTAVGILATDGIKSAADLVGKKIGYFPGTNSEYFLHEFLIKHGISKSDVVLVPISMDQVDGELGRRSIHAVSAFDPALSQLKQVIGRRAHVFYAPELYTFKWNIVASRRMLEYPTIMENLIRALHVAERYATENADDAITITSRYLRTGESQIKGSWNSLTLQVNLLQSVLVTFEREASWARELSQHNNAELPDFGKFIYVDAMKSILPNEMTVIE